MRLSGPIASILIISSLLIVGTALLIERAISQTHRNDVSQSLTAVLGTAERSLSIWAEHQRQTAAIWAESAVVREACATLHQVGNPDLPDHPAQQAIRRFFSPLLATRGYEGFFIISPEGRNLASTRDSNLGLDNLLLQQPERWAHLLHGQQLISLPQTSDVPLDRQDSQTALNPTMFAGATITDDFDQVIGILTLRINPEQGYLPILEQGRIGSSGETIAFDRSGLLICRSRFEEGARAAGLLGQEQSSFLNLWLPGAPEGPLSKAPRHVLFDALASGSNGGIELESHPNYRGAWVIAAWRHHPTLDIVLAVEQETAEAMRELVLARTGIAIFAGLSLLLIGGLGFFWARNRELDAQAKLALLQQVDAEERKFQTAFTATPAAVLICDSDGVIRHLNTVAARLRSETDVDPGQQLLDFPIWSSAESGRDLIAQMIGAADGQRREIRCANGQTYDIGINPFAGPDQNTWYLVDARDITARIHLQRQLEAALEAAQESVRAKDAFLATMSHEIRTPLNGILGMTRLLDDLQLPPAITDKFTVIRTCGENLLALINDILDLSKIQSGLLNLEETVFSPATLLVDVADVFGEQAAQKGITLSQQTVGQVPAAYRGDVGRIRQILNNLIANAIKFTEHGGVSLLASSDADRSLHLVVRDTGIGMSLSAQEAMYEPFRQADASITRRFGGTGLGLSIVKQLVDAMQGTITCDSQPGHGTCFEITLPLATATDDDLAALQHGQEDDSAIQERIAGGHVLIVDDNPVNRQLSRIELGRLNCQVYEAADGQEAVDLAMSRDFDLILMDCQMPVLDGFSATAAIRQQEGERRRTPIVAMTANAMSGDRERCLAAGMDDYISKPIERAALARVLAHFLPLIDGEPTAPAETDAPAPAASTAEHSTIGPGDDLIDELLFERQIAPLLAEQPDIYLACLDEMAKDCDAFLAAVQSAQADEVERCAHRLVSSCGSMGGRRLSDLAQGIDQALRSGQPLTELADELAMVDELVAATLAAFRGRAP